MSTTDSTTLKAIATAVAAKQLAAMRVIAPELAANYDAAATARTTAETALSAIRVAAKALTDALEADSATIAGCSTQIAALKALYPAAS